MSACSRGRLVSRPNVDCGHDQPTREETPFGKRMGANFQRQESNSTINLNSRSSKGSCMATRVASRESPLFKLEVLEQHDEGNYYRPKKEYRSGNNSEPMPGSLSNFSARFKSSAAEDDMGNVANQLKVIQETQDEILDSLRHDVEIIQTENTILRQNNTRLQSQVSQMNQLVADLSFDLRQMRDLIGSKQRSGPPQTQTESIGMKGQEVSSGRRKVKNERGGQEGKLVQVKTPSAGTPDKDRKRGKTKSEDADMRTPVTKTKQGEKVERSLAAAEAKTSKRHSKYSDVDPVDPPPHPQGSCFGGLFGRRKKSKEDY